MWKMSSSILLLTSEACGTGNNGKTNLLQREKRGGRPRSFAWHWPIAPLSRIFSGFSFPPASWSPPHTQGLNIISLCMTDKTLLLSWLYPSPGSNCVFNSLVPHAPLTRYLSALVSISTHFLSSFSACSVSGSGYTYVNNIWVLCSLPYARIS